MREHLKKLIIGMKNLNKKFGELLFPLAVRQGTTYLIPILMIGSIALVFMSLPIPDYQMKMERWFGAGWKNIFLYIRDGSFNIYALLAVLCISYTFANTYNDKEGSKIPPIMVSVVSLCSFVTVFGISKSDFNLSTFGVTGIFVALLISFFSSLLFIKLSTISFPRMKSYADGAEPSFQYAMAAIFPAAVTISVFAIVNCALIYFFGINNIQFFISKILNGIFHQLDSSFFSGVLFIFMIHVCWFFGIHGSNMMEPVAQNVFGAALYGNQFAIHAGESPIYIFTKTFFDNFVLMGGCGASLCLVLAILIAGKHKNLRKQAKLSIIPVLFNINELIIFGIPIILNPVYIIPFLFVPLLFTTISYLAMYLGFVPYTVHLVEWTTPILISGYFSTGSISGSILQLLNLAVGTLCYMPFVKAAENSRSKRFMSSLLRVIQAYKHAEEQGKKSALLNRYDEIGNISRFLTANLESALSKKNIQIYYQPQVNFKGEVFGAEALLKWEYGNYGVIYTPLVVALAEEAQIIDRLGYCIFDTACADLKKLNQLGITDVAMSVNVSAVQLENGQLVKDLEKLLKKYGVKAEHLKIEITERVALSGSKEILSSLKKVKDLGIQLALDDFGMGHNSLIYLKEYKFDTVKLDGSLIKELISNSNCENIVSSIVSLGKTLNYSVIAEYVEEEAQRQILHELGCDQYQGYLYSQALPYEQFISYLEKQRR